MSDDYLKHSQHRNRNHHPQNAKQVSPDQHSGNDSHWMHFDYMPHSLRHNQVRIQLLNNYLEYYNLYHHMRTLQ